MKQPTLKALRLLEELQSLDFALTELRLYLHTHPDDEEALAQFNELGEQRIPLKESVEEEFGSLAPYEPFHAGRNPGWGEGLWPWQL
ncbi:spore coat protein CotJB [Paenibacillus rhizovicinus]|uniref:Spore coat protein CotJB n=1 Tax=Paenibacillus rhizovicinus TaxID=2704463 RepID=A0A6C0NUI9_9BACL|nr:spore coat protein CotJB [Paenibacillus rhizovicinus]QHW29596.1 spore coat protein CotJB [Paenibacillus rhizovicinus]